MAMRDGQFRGLMRFCDRPTKSSTIALLIICAAACGAFEGKDKPAEALGISASEGEQDPNLLPAEVVETENVLSESSAAASETAERETGEQELEGPQRAQAPEGYGVLKLPVEAASAEELTMHSLAGYEVVAVYAEPRMDAEKLGFLRLGTRLRTTQKVDGSECRKGWYALEGGGFACASKGLVVDKHEPFMKNAPKPPRMDQSFPYDWAYVRKWNSPMWWRVPNGEERALSEERRAQLEAARTGEALPKKEEGTSPEKSGDSASSAENKAKLPDLEATKPELKADAKPESKADAKAELKADAIPDAKPEGSDPEAEAPEEEKEEISLPLSPGHPWLEKGFFLSLGETVSEGGRNYWRTARGGYVEKSNVYPYKTKDFAGTELTEEMHFPVGFVIKKGGTKLYSFDEEQHLKAGKKLEKRIFVDLSEEVEHKGKNYMMTEDGELLLKDHLRIPSLQPLPEGIEEWEHWIDIDLSTQLLVAYEGSYPVYVTLVSTGRKGTEEEPFTTPTGRWRIYSKQVTSNMDGSTASDGNYAIQDVPWVMYFEGSYALHGAFWHRSFGHVRSHGCVNLGPSDARWLFNWSTPYLPDRWHGVHASTGNPGSTVIVRQSEAKK